MGWGALHSLSPGHGKTMVAAYLVGTRGTARHALLLGLFVTVTHTIGVIALGLVTLFASRYILPEDLFPWINLVAAALVVAVGLWAGWGRTATFRRRLAHRRAHRRVPAHAPHAPPPDRERPMPALAMAARGGRARPTPTTHGHSHAHAHGPGHSHGHGPGGAHPRAAGGPLDAQPAGRRRVGRDHPVPLGAGAAARRDRAASGRLRPRAGAGVLGRAGRAAQRHRPAGASTRGASSSACPSTDASPRPSPRCRRPPSSRSGWC